MGGVEGESLTTEKMKDAQEKPEKLSMTRHFFGTPRSIRGALSCQYGTYDLSRRVGQSFLAAVVREGELGVVEAHQVEDRGVQVVDVDAVDRRSQSHLVGRAVDGAALDARRRQASR